LKYPVRVVQPLVYLVIFFFNLGPPGYIFSNGRSEEFLTLLEPGFLYGPLAAIEARDEPQKSCDAVLLICLYFLPKPGAGVPSDLVWPPPASAQPPSDYNENILFLKT
jgi:hypothetical protein